MNAAERWERFQQTEEMNDGGAPDDIRWLRTFAVRGDDVLVLFDADGWFTMEWRVGQFFIDGEAVEGKYIACDPDGTEHDVYCEPVWLAGYYDTITDNSKRGDNDE